MISQDNVNWKRKIDVISSTLDTFVISRFSLLFYSLFFFSLSLSLSCARCYSFSNASVASSLESVGSQIDELIDKYLINPLDDQDQSIA